MLDVGTDNHDRLVDPVYVGWRHERVRGEDYDNFVEMFIKAVVERWPHVLVQWEDFAGVNASRLLDRYRDQLCSFNDDIQGTAAVALGTLLAAVNVTGVPLTEQRIVFLGAGSAGIGIASFLAKALREAGLSQSEAHKRIFGVDKDGLLVEGMPGIRDSQRPFLQPRAVIANWKLASPDRITLLDVVSNVRPTVLIGVSGQAGAFTEDVIRTMAAGVERPIIFPLSNPTSRSEATAEDLIAWTKGRALLGTGSPFRSVHWQGRPMAVDQTNNSYIFPGMGLGILSVSARRVSDAMFTAAATCLAELSPTRTDKSGRLLPPVSEIRSVALAVAKAVARQAIAEALASAVDEQELESRIGAHMWSPDYLPYRYVESMA